MDEKECFLELNNFSPTEWPNIPRPLLLMMDCVKTCINQSKEVIEQLDSSYFKLNYQFSRFVEESEAQTAAIKAMIGSVDTNLTEKIEDIYAKLNEEINKFKSELWNDLDFKQRSADSRMKKIEEDTFTIKKHVGSLPTMSDIENLVKTSANVLRKQLPKEIHNNIITPEVSNVSNKLSTFIEGYEQAYSSTKEAIEANKAKIKKAFVQSEKLEHKLSEFDYSVNETNKNFFSLKEENQAVEAQIGRLVKDFKSLEQTTGASVTGFSNSISVIDSRVKTSENRGKELAGLLQVLKKKQDQLTEELQKNQSELESLIKEQESQKMKKIEKKKTQEELKEKSENLEKKTENFLEAEQIENPVYTSVNPKILSPVQSLVLPVKPNSPSFPSLTANIPLSLPEDAFLSDHVKVLESKLAETQSLVVSLESSSRSEKQEFESILKKINEKVQWLPFNMSDIKGKPPSEARLYTVEARLRNEENTRVEQFNFLLSVINQLKLDHTVIDTTHLGFPSISSGRNTARERRNSKEALSMPRKDDNKKEYFRTRRLSSELDRTSKNGYFSKLPVSQFLNN